MNVNMGEKNYDFFSKPWRRSDAVLVVESKELHVHRYILSLQSPVFEAMFNGNFKDATQERIELKDDDYFAMNEFLKLLYPTIMLGDEIVEIDDDNIFDILEIADKYTAIDVIKRCMNEAGNLEPENTLRLLPYAARHELPLEKILDVIARRIPTETLENFAPEIRDNSVYIKTLQRKCRFQENVINDKNTMLLYLLKKYVDREMWFYYL
ncbi:kelch-like protein 3 [Dendronephthya gigantea]|uniref:kelch-like protein 3 n=1 Tax=Dendronephthya gigantea TaxID=151771 RepID=UPI00106915A8|nr:kelch-like protein 3 [Dendronephthya gigantea]